MTIAEAKEFLSQEISAMEIEKLEPNDQEEAVKILLKKFEEFRSKVNAIKVAAIVRAYPTYEIWRDVLGYENIYKVSTFANVLSFHKGEPRLLKHSIHQKGYHLVTLYKNGECHCFGVHVLVARAFIPNPDNKPEVNHQNGNKDDNTVWNLEWSTFSENNEHAIKTGLKKSGVDSSKSKLTEEQVRLIRQICILGDDNYGVRALAKIFNVSDATIGAIVHGKTYKNVK